MAYYKINCNKYITVFFENDNSNERQSSKTIAELDKMKIAPSAYKVIQQNIEKQTLSGNDAAEIAQVISVY